MRFWTYLLLPKWNKMLCTMSTMVATVFYFVRKGFSNAYQLLVSRSVTFSFPLNYSESFWSFWMHRWMSLFMNFNDNNICKKRSQFKYVQLDFEKCTHGAKMIESKTNHWFILNTNHFLTKISLKKKILAVWEIY